jgi:hypothetical protein
MGGRRTRVEEEGFFPTENGLIPKILVSGPDAEVDLVGLGNERAPCEKKASEKSKGDPRPDCPGHKYPFFEVTSFSFFRQAHGKKASNFCANWL